MAGQIPDLWPQDIGQADLLAPVTILREQAALLGQKTNQLVTADVNTQTQGPFFLHLFYIVAPALDNYSYELFRVQHAITFYPMTVIYENTGRQIESQQQFVDLIAGILRSPKTANIVKSLIAQIER